MKIVIQQSKVDDSKKNSIVNSCSTKNLTESREKFLNEVSERYISAIRNADSNKGEVLWGGDIELGTISKLHNLKITVYHQMNDGIVSPYTVINSQNEKSIDLLLEGLHYNYLNLTSREWMYLVMVTACFMLY